MIKGFGHICYIVNDLDTAITFYTEKLGMSLAFDFINDKNERFGAYIHAGARNFVEVFVGQVSERVKGQSYGHLCLEVEDLQGMAANLRAQGVTVSEIKMAEDNCWQAWLTDPDGNPIELQEYTPESWQQQALTK
jgi:catechol 2,3-dioxygenase-like lactoylglutathione lyase family enzyme